MMSLKPLVKSADVILSPISRNLFRTPNRIKQNTLLEYQFNYTSWKVKITMNI